MNVVSLHMINGISGSQELKIIMGKIFLEKHAHTFTLDTNCNPCLWFGFAVHIS